MGQLEHIKEAVGRVMQAKKQEAFISGLQELLYKFGAEIRAYEDTIIVQFNEFKTPDIDFGNWIDCDNYDKDGYE